MLTERKWAAIAPQAFTANGTQYGVITVASTLDYRVKQKVIIKGDSLLTLTELEVKEVISETQLAVGKLGNITERFDLSAYTTAANSTLEAPRQDRSKINPDVYNRVIFEEEPILANRNILVDRFGRHYHTANPLPVQLSDGAINIGTVQANIEVHSTHLDDSPVAGRVHDSFRLGDGVETAEIKPDGTVQVGEGNFNSEQELGDGTSLGAAFNTSSVDTQGYSRGFLKAVWIGADLNNEATFVIEVSDDQTDWSQLGESGMALIEQADTQIWQFLEFPARYFRLAYTDNGNSGGTVDIDFMGKY